MKKTIAKYQTVYQNITPVFSPAIGDRVYFNQRGFKHLIFKGKHRRDNKTIHDRLVLIPLIVPVIKQCEEEVEIRIRRENIAGDRIKVIYYALEAHVGNDKSRIRVVTRKIGKKGKHYFQSVMKYN